MLQFQQRIALLYGTTGVGRHQAIADNKYLLLQSGMRLEVEEMQDTVYSDEKWVRFILNQLIWSFKHLSLRLLIMSTFSGIISTAVTL